MNKSLDKIGGIGSVASAIAAAAPCCLPLLASVATAVGFSSLLPYSAFIVYVVQAFAVIAVLGEHLSYRKHHKIGPLVLSILSTVALIYAYNVSLFAWLLYSGLAGLIIAAIWNTLESRRCKQCQVSV